MTMSDPIADMLTRIRNANTAKHDTDVYKRQTAAAANPERNPVFDLLN